jgi:cytochrome c oxidase cbb3-type subunit 2
MTVLRTLGVPYTDAQIAAGASDVAGHSEADALITYLQHPGINMIDYARQEAAQ